MNLEKLMIRYFIYYFCTKLSNIEPKLIESPLKMSESPNLTPPSIVKRFHLAPYYHHYHVILLAYVLL